MECDCKMFIGGSGKLCPECRKKEKEIDKWIREFWKSDIGQVALELSAQATHDYFTTGNYYDYASELGLCLKHQGFIK